MQSSSSIDWFGALLSAGPIGIGTIIILILMSLLSWSIIIFKLKHLNSYFQKSEKFLKLFWEAKSLSELNVRVKELEYSPARDVFKSGFNELLRVLQIKEKKAQQNPNASKLVPFDTIKRSLIRQKMVEEALMSNHLPLLAIAASSSPFIGLFGTVIGIIEAFHQIGLTGGSSLAEIAPGISEALFTTALGLFVAIPSLVFYNFFVSKIKRHLSLIDCFCSDFLNIVERHYNIGN